MDPTASAIDLTTEDWVHVHEDFSLMNVYKDNGRDDARLLLCIVLGRTDIPYSSFERAPWTEIKFGKKKVIPDREMLREEIGRRWSVSSNGFGKKRFPCEFTMRSMTDWLKSNPRQLTATEISYFSGEISRFVSEMQDTFRVVQSRYVNGRGDDSSRRCRW